jgi:hypothetical protein
MKLLGFDPFKREDTIEQIAKLKALTGSLMDVMPNGQQLERPGIFEKLVDAVAPHIPKIFGDLRAMTDNAAMAQKLMALRAAQATPTGEAPVQVDARPTTRYGQPIGPQLDRMGADDAFAEPVDMDPYSGFTTRPFQASPELDAGVREELTGAVAGATPEQMREAYLKKNGRVQAPAAPQRADERPPEMVTATRNGTPAPQVIEEPVHDAEMPPLLQQLVGLIEQDLTDAYGPLYETLLMDDMSKAMMEAVQQRQADGEMLALELAKTGFKPFTSPMFISKAKTYLNGFVAWVLANTVKRVVTACPICHAQHIFGNNYEFIKSDRICGAPVGGNETCPGEVELRTKDEALLPA